jgi:hypothetical protein
MEDMAERILYVEAEDAITALRERGIGGSALPPSRRRSPPPTGPIPVPFSASMRSLPRLPA